MKKNGFTLIELLAVIVILAIIALITVISVGSVLTDSKNSLSETQQKKVEEAAKTYYIKEGMSENVTCVNISDLIDKGYIEGTTVLDPKTSEEMNGSVLISYVSNQYNYQYQESACE